jgi:hypothetical protein
VVAFSTSRPSWRHHRGGASSDLSLLGLLPASLLGEAGPGSKLLLLFRRVSSSGVSVPSALSLMVSEYQMPGGVPPLPPFPYWMVVRGPGCAGGCHHHFHGRSSCPMILGLRVHRHGARISNAGWCGLGCVGGCHQMVEGTMAMVKPASMLFGGGASRRSVDVFRLVSRLFLEFVYQGSSLFPLCVFGCSISSGSAMCAQCYA